MNKNIKNIIKEKLIRINLSKNEIKKKLLKSISQNNNIQNNMKIYTNYIITKKIKKNNFISRKLKICIYTGKRSSILKGFSFSRYTIKSFILQNKLTNLKKNNW